MPKVVSEPIQAATLAPVPVPDPTVSLGVFVARLDNGGVRVSVSGKGFNQDVDIDAQAWANVVANVSGHGETPEAVELAKSVHAGTPIKELASMAIGLGNKK